MTARSAYLRITGVAGGLLGRIGLLGLLDRWAPRSRLATWLRSLFAIYDLEGLSGLDVPWWTFASADLVDAHLAARPGARVFEWGSGASTLWLARRAAGVHSVEHDGAWADRLRAVLPAHVELTLVPPVASTRPEVGSRKKGHQGLDFTDYVSAIDATEGVYDVIVVDGRAREACLDHALHRLAPDGLLVFDNVDRRRYRDAIDRLGAQVTVTTTRGLTPALPYPTRTALLRRATS
ncbi:class I SAM-dependent methyltransferase [Nocardioides nitrophenolicus]|uniref:class I SAM-dependent methyltransferase n=1 Tax=Nocardioides nitrophenolicus TaxID=60489 RepID=UPI00195B1B3F|nr:class I SAM-dependent methyltransferase [Nocardioides nitrophenolicus]MBM7515402.1 putative O-methyltransferase YrrM [Nocardioides nitrophenolicus]